MASEKFENNVVIPLLMLVFVIAMFTKENRKKLLENIDAKFADENKLFVVLSVKRPVRIIGSDIDIEFFSEFNG